MLLKRFLTFKNIFLTHNFLFLKRFFDQKIFFLTLKILKNSSDIDDTKEGVREKVALLATLPRSRAKRLLNNWTHPFSMMLRGRDHAGNILSGNSVQPRSSQLKQRRAGSLGD